MSELLDTFIGESRENLESASQELLTLQNSGYDAKAVDTIFRDIHTIKGSSDLFDIKPLTRLAHASEDLLDCIHFLQLLFSQIKAASRGAHVLTVAHHKFAVFKSLDG